MSRPAKFLSPTPQEVAEADSTYVNQPRPSLNTYTVQLEDGSIETFQVDSRVGPDLLPRLLEGAVRARTRQKAGQPPTAPTMAPTNEFTSISDWARRGAAGVAEVPLSMGRDFVEGLRIVNKQPGMAAGLVAEGVPRAIGTMVSDLSKAASPVTMLKALRPETKLEALTDMVQGIPVIGPMANQAGVRMAAGEGPEAVGNIAGETFMTWLGAKAGMSKPSALKASPKPTHVTIPLPIQIATMRGPIRVGVDVPPIPKSLKKGARRAAMGGAVAPKNQNIDNAKEED